MFHKVSARRIHPTSIRRYTAFRRYTDTGRGDNVFIMFEIMLFFLQKSMDW